MSRFKDQGNKAGPEEVLVDRLPASRVHNAGTIDFGPDGKLYVPIGDVSDRSNAQDLESMAGIVHRFNSNGSIPEDNPFQGSSIYSYGYRNIFGLAWATRYRTDLYNRERAINGR